MMIIQPIGFVIVLVFALSALSCKQTSVSIASTPTIAAYRSHLTEYEVTNILYDYIMNKAEQYHNMLENPQKYMEVESGIIGWAFDSASGEGLSKVNAEVDRRLKDILSGTPGPLPELTILPYFNRQKLRYGTFTADVWTDGLKGIAKYEGEDWWNVELGDRGLWRVNEIRKEVQAQDNKARSVLKDYELCHIAQPTTYHEGSKTVSQYINAIAKGNYLEKYSKVTNQTLTLVDLKSQVSSQTRAAGLSALSKTVGSLFNDFRAIEVQLEAREFCETTLLSMNITLHALNSFSDAYSQVYLSTLITPKVTTNSVQKFRTDYSNALDLLGKGIKLQQEALQQMLQLLKKTDNPTPTPAPGT